MKAAHTKGPWSTGFYTDGNVDPHVDMVVVTAPKSKRFVTQICTMPVQGRGVANATLMASSPDLLGALKELVRCVRGGDEASGFSMDDALADADAAIEKATIL